LLYPPDEGLLYRPDDDGREEGDDEDLDGEDEEPFAATRSVTEASANTERKTIPTRNNCFFMRMDDVAANRRENGQ